MRIAILGAALVLLAACSPVCGGPATAGSAGCGHPGLCLTLSGPLAGTTSLVQAPDCIPGGGIDLEFITHVGGHETSIEILVTDNSTKTGFHPGSFSISPSKGARKDVAFASVFIKPDSDVAGYTGGWSTDQTGSSGTVVVNGDQSGKVQDAVVAPAKGSGTPLHVSGTFNCK